MGYFCWCVLYILLKAVLIAVQYALYLIFQEINFNRINLKSCSLCSNTHLDHLTRFRPFDQTKCLCTMSMSYVLFTWRQIILSRQCYLDGGVMLISLITRKNHFRCRHKVSKLCLPYHLFHLENGDTKIYRGKYGSAKEP